MINVQRVGMPLTPSARFRRIAAAALVVALVAAGVGTADNWTIRLTPQGQAAARAAVVARNDLASGGNWSGGSVKPELNSTPLCGGWKPKQSDLVVIGAAETRWQGNDLLLDSQASVLKTAAMVKLDWQRTMLAPQTDPCLRKMLTEQLPATASLVSFKRLAFPQVATYTRAYRALLDIAGSANSVRFVTDIVVVGSGRTEITLLTMAQSSTARAVFADETRIIRRLVARART
jgi:hypothetical protein